MHVVMSSEPRMLTFSETKQEICKLSIWIDIEEGSGKKSKMFQDHTTNHLPLGSSPLSFEDCKEATEIQLTGNWQCCPAKTRDLSIIISTTFKISYKTFTFLARVNSFRDIFTFVKEKKKKLWNLFQF